MIYEKNHALYKNNSQIQNYFYSQRFINRNQHSNFIIYILQSENQLKFLQIGNLLIYVYWKKDHNQRQKASFHIPNYKQSTGY